MSGPPGGIGWVLILIHGHLLISAAIDHKAADHKAATSCRTPKRGAFGVRSLISACMVPPGNFKGDRNSREEGKRGTGEQGKGNEKLENRASFRLQARRAITPAVLRLVHYVGSSLRPLQRPFRRFNALRIRWGPRSSVFHNLCLRIKLWLTSVIVKKHHPQASNS